MSLNRCCAQFEGAADWLQRSFAALMLGYLHGDVINMAPVVDTFGILLTNVNDYARSVLGTAASAIRFASGYREARADTQPTGRRDEGIRTIIGRLGDPS
jgi:hypothetical protein